MHAVNLCCFSYNNILHISFQLRGKYHGRNIKLHVNVFHCCKLIVHWKSKRGLEKKGRGVQKPKLPKKKTPKPNYLLPSHKHLYTITIALKKSFSAFILVHFFLKNLAMYTCMFKLSYSLLKKLLVQKWLS